MIHDPAALVVTAGAVVAALGIIWAAVRRFLRGTVALVTLLRDLLQLQPRVIALAERLTDLVDEMRTWRVDYDHRLTRLESAVLTEPERAPHAQ